MTGNKSNQEIEDTLRQNDDVKRDVVGWPIEGDLHIDGAPVPRHRRRTRRVGGEGGMNPHLRAQLDAIVPPIALTPIQIADLRDADAVLTCAGTQWLFRSRMTGRWVRMPVADLKGRTDVEAQSPVEDALDRLDDLPALHAYIPPIRRLEGTL